MGKKVVWYISNKSEKRGQQQIRYKERKKERRRNCMGKKELTTLVTRAKSAGNNKHDVKKERKKTKLHGMKGA